MTTSDNTRGAVDPAYNGWFVEEVPEAPEGSSLAVGLKLIETYTGLPPDEVPRHVKTIRDKAFALHRYPCLGRWRFLQLWIQDHPQYDNVLARLKAGETLLDAGCCFGHVLRQLAAAGAPAENLAGADVDASFVDLGYELFMDRGQFAARFVAGDVLAGAESLAPLRGQFNMVHTSSFFHLFGWDEQVRLGEAVAAFLRPGVPGCMIFGRQSATVEALPVARWREQQDAAEAAGNARRPYRHDLGTWKELWDEVGRRTGTKWEVKNEFSEKEMWNNADGFQAMMMQVTMKRVE